MVVAPLVLPQPRIVGLNDGFVVTFLVLWSIVVLIVVTREETMCNSRFWLLRVLGVEAQLQSEQFSSAGRCWRKNWV